MQRSPQTLIELLQWRAAVNGSKLAYLFVEDSEEAEIPITYAELDIRARAIAAELTDWNAAGERALLLYPPGLDFIAAFFGCLYAGVTAVPVYPPRLNRPMPRIQAIVRDADARFALTTATILDGVEKRFEHEPLLQGLQWRDTELTPDARAVDWRTTGVTENDLAFLQYTSGSTSAPKGVMLTHANLIHNLEMIRRGFHLGDDERGIFWLPSYHDMGLIGGILEPLYIAGSSMLISPVAFLQRPFRWLRGITAFKATITGAPNFAFDLCVDKITSEQQAEIDLSSLRLCFTGAEPVRRSTITRFSETFGRNGFRESVLYPCYGLAEATLLVAGGDGPGELTHKRLDREALKQNQAVVVGEETDGQDFIACGRALPGEEIAIVDPESQTTLSEGEIGEIWVRGPHVARGYWGKPELSEQTFSAYTNDAGESPYLRTGDLGFLLQGELFITGRMKDLIIIRGKNHYPQDIEETFSAAHEAIEKLSTVAFSYDEDGQEKLAVVAEVTRQHRNPDMDAIVPVLKRAVADIHGLQIDSMILVKPLSIPKTSSGKVKRQATRQQFLEGELTVIAQWAAKDEEARKPVFSMPGPVRERPVEAGPLLKWLLGHLETRLKLPPGTIDADEAFVTYGIDSALAVSLTADLEDFLGRTLSPTLAWDYPTPRQLAVYLSGSGSMDRPAAHQPAKRLEERAVAVIGLACRFPGASTPDEFWNLLTHGIDAVRLVPADRFDVEALYDPDPDAAGKVSTRWGGFLVDVAGFDTQFFGISPREAARMDPQQRLLLETAWEALESAGIPADRLAGSQTGVFIGISSYDYSRAQFQDLEWIDAYAGTGNAHSIAANRLSYFLDLRGPSLAVDTACSSSLVSVHMACRSLRGGESDLAIAGGVNLILSPELTITFSQARMMAADGRCKTFDARADGYVRGEGCGVVILKRLQDALRDGDPVLAVVRGSAVNQDGHTNGLTAPNGPSQEAVIRSALLEAGVSPQEVDYVEAHGTGTPLGDPIELHALRNVFGGRNGEDKPLFVGSVKTNIGHLEAAAGIAGLIKAVLALNREAIPPHLHFETLNPYISLDGAPLIIPTRVNNWPRRATRRHAGVSSFGFGGTNAHIVLSEAPQLESPPDDHELNRQFFLIPLSARTQPALRDAAKNLSTAKLPSLEDTALTLQAGRKHFEHRQALVCSSKEDLITRLGDFLASPIRSSTGRPVIAFLFTGQGAQLQGMTRALYAANPVYRESLDACAALIAPHLDVPLLDLIFLDDGRIHETRYAQPALFAVEYSMARMWLAWGIRPDYLLGHSIGEWTAACISGVVSLEDALRLVALRGSLMQSAPGEGGMLAVVASEPDVNGALGPFADRLSIAAVNGPKSLAVSGAMAALREFSEECDRRGWTNSFLNVSHGFHSCLMDPVLAEFRESLKEVQFKLPRIPIAANADGELRSTDRDFEPNYWVGHVRNTVRFADGVSTLLDSGVDLFVEVGPQPTLLGLTRRILSDRQVQAELLPTVNDSAHDWETALTSLGRMYEFGIDVDWEAFNSGVRANKVQLPTYPFQRERFWIEAERRAGASPGAPVSTGKRLSVSVPVFETHLERIDQHVVIELALAAGREVFGSIDCRLKEIRFDLPAQVTGAALVQTVLTEVNAETALFSVLAKAGEGWLQLAAGALSSGRIQPQPAGILEKVDSFQGSQVQRNGDAAVRREKPVGVDSAARLADLVGGVLGIPAANLPAEKPLNLLGLDSLMAIEVRNAVEKEFSIEIPIVILLAGPTLQELAKLLRERVETQAATGKIEARDTSGSHPLSIGQQALWFLHELTGEDASFNIAGAVKINGDFEFEAFRTAIESLVETHPALTTTFTLEEGDPVQELHPGAAVPLVEIDARHWTEDRIALYLRKEAWRKFNLEAGPPFRVRVLKTFEDNTARSHIVLFSVDHIVADFWSVSLIVEHLLEAYQAALSGVSGPDLQKPAIQFVDAVRWLDEGLKSGAADEHLAYWRSRFENGFPALNLPTDRPRPPMQTYQGETAFRRLPADLSRKVKGLAQAEGTTLFNVLLAAYDVLLHRYSGQDEFVVGSVMAGRDRPELENIVGYLINPVALKADFSSRPTFRECLAGTRQSVLEAFEHQAYPPPLLAEKLDLQRDHSRPPLFETMFIFQKAQVMGQAGLSAFAIGLPGARISAGSLDLEIHPLGSHPAQFDLTLMMAEVDDELMASIQFNTALFDAGTIDRMLAHFEQLLEGIVTEPGRPVRDYLLLTPDEIALLDGWNREAERAFPDHATLVDLIDARKGPAGGKPAVIFGEDSLTYAELNRRANHLAAHLQSLGMGRGKLAGVYMRRSLELPVALLAILKAGGAYVPLDPAFPQARIAFMIEDAGLDLVLTDEAFMDEFPPAVRTVDVRAVPENGAAFSPVELQPGDLAYIIYTSGSTGKPKGVQIPHSAVVNFMFAMQEWPGIIPEDVLLAVTTLSFDISVLEIFLPLVSGAQLVIAGEDLVRDGAALAAAVDACGATIMQATPSTWRLMLESGWDGKPDLKILCGGEAMPGALAADLLPRCSELWNMYGPTETTIWSTTMKVEQAGSSIPIGAPIANTQVYILDDQLRRLPIGVFGELCIAGRGLAVGYHDRPELTAEKFMVIDSVRVYRTGDLARLLPEGTLDFAGRRDSQVKVRGYRIELGEIETLMTRFDGVRQAVVGVHRRGMPEAILVGYIVLEPDVDSIDIPDLRQALLKILPEYMVPAVLIKLEALPLTPNGKVDRSALPAPEDERPELGTEYVPPRNEIEAKLAALCAETLGLDRVGVKDNFFDLGGTSLQATRLVFRVRDEFGRQVLLRRLFEEPTVEGLAAALEEAKSRLERGFGILDRMSIEELLAAARLEESIRGDPSAWKPEKLDRILLTGATGYLGAFLLRELLDRTEADIVVHVRSVSIAQAFERVRANLDRYGLWEDSFSDRILPLLGDLEKPLLGLSAEEFAQLGNQVDSIYHNGALVNFVQNFEGHRPANVHGTHEVLRLAATGRIKPVHFVSTLSVFHTGVHEADHAYTEREDLTKTGAPIGGYAQSKWAAEMLVQEAARRGIPAAIYRPGVISGHSETGAWNYSDMTWGLARACFTLGKIPRLEGTVDVVPVDFVSKAIVHLSLNQDPDGRVYHLGNPKTFPYDKMVELTLQLGLPVDEVSFDDWRDALFRHSMAGTPNEWNTFLPIIEEVEVEQIFMPRFNAANTLAGLAGSGISCPPVGPKLLEHYLDFFNEVGFFAERMETGD